MPNKYSSGKYAIAECDRCGQRYKLKELRKLTIKTKQVDIKVCKTCWEPDQPQLQLGMYPVNDPQAVRDPRPDTGYYVSGIGGDGGSRVIQWGWAPVGLRDPYNLEVNQLVAVGAVGTVTVSTT